MIKAIFFDFWGTLIENGVHPSPVRQVKNILRLYRLPFPLFIIQFERSFMTQEFDDLYKAFENVCREFKMTPNQHLLDQLVGMWNKNKLLAKPYPDTLETLKELRKKYKLVLVSNTDCFSVKSVIDKYNLSELFDEQVFSYKEGKLKSNPELFEDTLKKLKLKKEQVVMVGDSMESDIAGAKNAGLRAVLIDRRETREYEDKITSLEQLEQTIKGW